eukprot:1385195-Pleurochrysis_carterae.AAC.1
MRSTTSAASWETMAAMRLLLFSSAAAALRIETAAIFSPRCAVVSALRCSAAPQANAKRDAAGFLAPEELGDWVNLAKSNDLGASTLRELPEAAKKVVDKMRSDTSAMLQFEEVMSAIEDSFEVTEVSFSVGDTESATGENMGSAKIFSFGKLAGLTEEETLRLFGQYYKDVLDTPNGSDHANIRSFMASGWAGVKFPWGLAISPKLAEFATSKDSVAEALAKSAQITGEADWDPDSEIWIP